MLEIKPTGRFRRDLKLAAKRGYDFSALDEVVTLKTAVKMISNRLAALEKAQ